MPKGPKKGARDGVQEPSPQRPGNPPIRQPRRKHTNVACIHCYKAKAGCDVGRPCRRCVRLGKDNCVNRPLKKRMRRNKSSKKEHEANLFSTFLESLETLPQKPTSIMMHPGICNKSLPNVFTDLSSMNASAASTVNGNHVTTATTVPQQNPFGLNIPFAIVPFMPPGMSYHHHSQNGKHVPASSDKGVPAPAMFPIPMTQLQASGSSNATHFNSRQMSEMAVDSTNRAIVYSAVTSGNVGSGKSSSENSPEPAKKIQRVALSPSPTPTAFTMMSLSNLETSANANRPSSFPSQASTHAPPEAATNWPHSFMHIPSVVMHGMSNISNDPSKTQTLALTSDWKWPHHRGEIVHEDRSPTPTFEKELRLKTELKLKTEPKLKTDLEAKITSETGTRSPPQPQQLNDEHENGQSQTGSTEPASRLVLQPPSLKCGQISISHNGPTTALPDCNKTPSSSTSSTPPSTTILTAVAVGSKPTSSGFNATSSDRMCGVSQPSSRSQDFASPITSITSIPIPSSIHAQAIPTVATHSKYMTPVLASKVIPTSPTDDQGDRNQLQRGMHRSKRPRNKYACQACYKAKTKCSPHLPCNRCDRLKILCQQRQHTRRKGRPPKTRSGSDGGEGGTAPNEGLAQLYAVGGRCPLLSCQKQKERMQHRIYEADQEIHTMQQEKRNLQTTYQRQLDNIKNAEKIRAMTSTATVGALSGKEEELRKAIDRYERAREDCEAKCENIKEEYEAKLKTFSDVEVLLLSAHSMTPSQVDLLRDRQVLKKEMQIEKLRPKKNMKHMALNPTLPLPLHSAPTPMFTSHLSTSTSLMPTISSGTGSEHRTSVLPRSSQYSTPTSHSPSSSSAWISTRSHFHTNLSPPRTRSKSRVRREQMDDKVDYNMVRPNMNQQEVINQTHIKPHNVAPHETLVHGVENDNMEDESDQMEGENLKIEEGDDVCMGEKDQMEHDFSTGRMANSDEHDRRVVDDIAQQPNGCVDREHDDIDESKTSDRLDYEETEGVQGDDTVPERGLIGKSLSLLSSTMPVVAGLSTLNSTEHRYAKPGTPEPDASDSDSNPCMVPVIAFSSPLESAKCVSVSSVETLLSVANSAKH